ncbi:hypothetical protein HPP92_011999 [Vanilla planifolia]|uniref:Uncharacterized protein n=1 Tax=Vanilla planifolia TaxID=51239 RepID=A0A835R1R3_VANPL|nr:hypothetical protein HPP92_011999 [Vanilla planifolia]
MDRGKVVLEVEDDEEETLEEIEGFDDFTTASTWEKSLIISPIFVYGLLSRASSTSNLIRIHD